VSSLDGLASLPLLEDWRSNSRPLLQRGFIETAKWFRGSPRQEDQRAQEQALAPGVVFAGKSWEAQMLASRHKVILLFVGLAMPPA
jgi:hypothetical protein